jgi:hypothetical protein
MPMVFRTTVGTMGMGAEAYGPHGRGCRCASAADEAQQGPRRTPADWEPVKTEPPPAALVGVGRTQSAPPPPPSMRAALARRKEETAEDTTSRLRAAMLARVAPAK